MKNAPNLQALRVLIAVSKSQNFKEAAAKVGRTANAVSASIARLEEHYNQRLVIRPKKGGVVTLTAFGQVICDRAERAMRTLEGGDQDSQPVRVDASAVPKPPLTSIGNPTIYRRHISELEGISRRLYRYYEAWEGSKTWSSINLRPFHHEMLCAKPNLNSGSLVVFHVGERHGSCVHFGEAWRQNIIGNLIDADPLGDEYIAKTSAGYFEVLQGEVAVLDTVLSQGAQDNGEITFLAYHRLLTRCLLDDGQAIAVNLAAKPRRFSRETDARLYLAPKS